MLGDAASIVGGVRSLLLQLTHPLAMAGVADHSRYLDDPLGRLQHTAAYFARVTFGSTDEVLSASRIVRARHAAVVGRTPDGRPYDASSPELLTWVSVTATASFLRCHDLYGATALDPQQRDAFVAEQARAASLLDPRVDLVAARADRQRLMAGSLPLPLIDDGWMPTTEAALSERLASFDDMLAVGQQGRTCLRFLLWPPVEPVLRLGYLPVVAGALASLEPSTRRLLGTPLPDASTAVLRLQSELALVALRAATARRESPNVEYATARAAAA